MFRIAATIFLSAFLLFQVQPLIARLILPWYGGTAAVWTTCLMFFQFVLLLGYSYSHGLQWALSRRGGWLMHAILLIAAACLLNVMPAENMQPSGNENPTVAILKTLTRTVGLPFFLLASSSPLIQAWAAEAYPARSPYRLYALSNLGSMLALISYPFWFERYFSLEHQVYYWQIGFMVFSGLCCWSGLHRVVPSQAVSEFAEPTAKLTMYGSGTRAAVWILLSAGTSILLLATTNLMCQEVASVPFLWLLPLSLYLLSFIICFDRPAWYRRQVFMYLLIISTIVSVFVVHLNVHAGFGLQIGALATVLFAACMTCHGELERLKPTADALTWFYLLLAMGGAIGGIFVAVLAPLWFDGFYEFQIGLLICLLVPLGVALFESKRVHGGALSRWGITAGVLIAATLVSCSLFYFLDPSFRPDILTQARNEYGLVSVVENNGYRKFINGRIEHGGQFQGSERGLNHSSYYQPGTGVAISFKAYRDILDQTCLDRGLNVGVLGLGAGGMMTWGEPADRFTFYEINPEVEKIAREYFSFLSDSPAKSEVVLGDGRLQLQRRSVGFETLGAAERRASQKFDLLFMDAFSSDSIPVHLLTAECFEIYLNNLKPNGILVAHITNRFVDLRPVIFQHSIDFHLTPFLIDSQSPGQPFKTRWVILTRNTAIIQSSMVSENAAPWPTDMKPIRWTDDHASLAEILDWSGQIDWTQLKNLKHKPATNN